MTEDERIARWVRHWPPGPAVTLGPGDDCALLAPLPRGCLAVAKTDAVIEGRHFTRRDPARLVGRKALARAVSDFAAMGATPTSALIACLLPGGAASGRWMDAAMRGMAAAARGWSVGLAGGETTRGPVLGLTVMLHGWVARRHAVTRAGGRAGDALFVTGRLGGSRRGHHLRFTPRLEEGSWLARHRFVNAMMDLSDGLGRDLPRLAAASGTSYRMEPCQLPRRPGCSADEVVNDGEDYELLLAVPSAKAARLQAAWPFKTRLTRIGSLLPRAEAPHTGGLPFRGYDHFR